MPYSDSGRVIHDADAHILETPDWFEGFAEERVVASLRRILEPYCRQEVSRCRALHEDAAYRDRDAEELMVRKNWQATGSFLSKDRPGALDLLGFSSQLIFPTMTVGYLAALEHRDDMDLLYGTAEASNRAMSAFCSPDSRLLAVGYVPLADLSRVAEAIGYTLAACVGSVLGVVLLLTRRQPKKEGRKRQQHAGPLRRQGHTE